MSRVIVEDNSEQFLNAKDEAITRFLEEAGLHLEGQAKKELENSPRRVDTGLLRNSITHAMSGKSAAIRSYHASKGSNRYKSGKNAGKRVSASSKNAGAVGMGFYSGTAPEEPDGQKAMYVGTNVEYAPYVHEGTRRMTANRFIRNAFERNAAQIEKKLKVALKGL